MLLLATVMAMTTPATAQQTSFRSGGSLDSVRLGPGQAEWVHWRVASAAEPVPALWRLQDEERPAWIKPAIFIGAGALAGAAWGTYVMATADDPWIGPPAHIVTIPVGTAVGVVLALIF